ncbi:hypothetical protein AcW1_001674 [Taiwanofungus camphoratus]|nr:hypothetical protein AcV5_000282 [Antrodia cinnamomea]KAI0944842.1 hypothetical protein AcV7_001532 [Antrodia cinnamomea]KAI0945457.1 hypothetical protein AcW1_001674 [Antrodia cinnamomea]
MSCYRTVPYVGYFGYSMEPLSSGSDLYLMEIKPRLPPHGPAFSQKIWVASIILDLSPYQQGPDAEGKQTVGQQ